MKKPKHPIDDIAEIVSNSIPNHSPQWRLAILEKYDEKARS
jgi:hypothetical protein